MRLALPLVLVAALGCEPQPEDPTASPPAASMMHDHTPHHGGAVSMVGDLHIETVADANGQLRVYLSDLRRRSLPTARVTGSVTVARPDGRLTLPLSPAGEWLEAVGPPLPVGDMRVRVALMRDGREVEAHHMRKILAATGFVILLGGGIRLVGATVQWWTPEEKDCPTFDTQASCVAWCTQDPARCSGSTSCINSSGPARPPC